jgi:hypothetical protein
MQQGASGRRAKAIGVAGTPGRPAWSGRPGPLFGPRCASSSGKPLAHFQIYAPKFIVQRPHEPLRKIHASLPSLKIPENLLQFLSFHIRFCAFSLLARNPRESFWWICATRHNEKDHEHRPRKKDMIIITRGTI